MRVVNHLGLLLDGEGGGGEGVALAVPQLPLLRAVAQDVINVLHASTLNIMTPDSNKFQECSCLPAHLQASMGSELSGGHDMHDCTLGGAFEVCR